MGRPAGRGAATCGGCAWLLFSKALPPDGRRIAVTIGEATSDVYLYDIARDTLSRFTSGSTDANPFWSPDGKRLAFQSDRAGAKNLFSQSTDGSGTAERLTTDIISIAGSWSPDGQRIAFQELNPETGNDIWTVGLADRMAKPFLKTPANEAAPQFSPDGQWIAYVSDETGRWEVYVRPYPGPGARYPISTEGGTEPMWNPSGHELFYRTGNRMMAVDVSFAAGVFGRQAEEAVRRPVVAYSFDCRQLRCLTRRQALFDAESCRTQTTPARHIVVVQNWFEVLKKRNK